MQKTPDFMALALQEAEKAAARGEVPVGAVLVDGAGNILAKAGNEVRSEADPTGHAEILAIRRAAKLRESERLTDCDLWVTLEPCAMCAAAIAQARLRRVYFGAEDAKGGGVVSGIRYFEQPTCHHRPEVYGGFAEAEAGALLKAFFKARR